MARVAFSYSVAALLHNLVLSAALMLLPTERAEGPKRGFCMCVAFMHTLCAAAAAEHVQARCLIDVFDVTVGVCVSAWWSWFISGVHTLLWFQQEVGAPRDCLCRLQQTSCSCCCLQLMLQVLGLFCMCLQESVSATALRSAQVCVGHRSLQTNTEKPQQLKQQGLFGSRLQVYPTV